MTASTNLYTKFLADLFYNFYHSTHFTKAAYCKPFTIGVGRNGYAVLDILYQPDFTMSVVRKKLTLETSIGELHYQLEVRIPSHLLSVCHDSLPRPLIETYLFYFGLFSTLCLSLVMLLASLFESRSIVRLVSRHIAIAGVKQLQHVFNVHDILAEYQLQLADTRHSLTPLNEQQQQRQPTVPNTSAKSAKTATALAKPSLLAGLSITLQQANINNNNNNNKVSNNPSSSSSSSPSPRSTSKTKQTPATTTSKPLAPTGGSSSDQLKKQQQQQASPPRPSQRQSPPPPQ